MAMKISVNCPSYKRPYVETLEYLPFCKVWVDNKEYDDYISANPGHEENIISVPDGIQGNVSRIRNYILDQEFANGMEAVVMLDDDLKGVYEWLGTKEAPYEKVRVESDEFLDFIEKYSIICDGFGFKFWGCNCNSDCMSYRQYSPFSTICFVGGPFQCFLPNPLRYDENLPLKEDYDMTLQQCNMYRGVLRVNFAFYDCKQSEQPGGCSAMRNYVREKQQFDAFQKKWGKNIVKMDGGESRVTRKKEMKKMDYNPIIKIPIAGI